MSKSKLSTKDTVHMWVRAGGRCEYPGCNKVLWRDDLSLARMNTAYLAHIYGDQPGGPRYEAGTSERLARDPANFMLLCDVHHRLIDREDVDGHPAIDLLQFKNEHEERIELLTAIQAQRKTHVLLFGSRIGDHSGLVCFDQAREAVVASGRWPETSRGIRIGMPDAPFSDRNPAYWALVKANIEQELERTISAGIGPTGKPITHLSVFALAPIPALIYFGKTLGDIVTADIYQRHRDKEDWIWRHSSVDDFDYRLRPPHLKAVNGVRRDHVAVSVAISAPVPDKAVLSALDDSPPIYQLRVDNVSTRAIQSADQVELFACRWRNLLTRIQNDHGKDVQISLFPAIPVSIAVQLGRELLPKGDPPIVIYDKQGSAGYIRALMV